VHNKPHPPHTHHYPQWALATHEERVQSELLHKGLRLELDYAKLPPWLELTRIFEAQRQVIGNIEKTLLKVEIVSPIFWNRTLQINLLEDITQQKAIAIYQNYRHMMGDGIPVRVRWCVVCCCCCVVVVVM
jgi:flagellar biosynthesis protein FlhB